MNTLCRKRFFNRTYGVIILVIGLTSMIGAPLWSQSEEQPEFVIELLDILAEEGWTADEVRALAAQDIDWGEVEGANPDVVALGLQFAKEEDGEMDFEPMWQAVLAIGLARSAIEMEALGIGELSIAMTALEGVREILTDIQSFRSDGMTGEELGETISNIMREQVGAVARKNAQDRISERVKEVQEILPEDFVPDFTDDGSDFLPSVP